MAASFTSEQQTAAIRAGLHRASEDTTALILREGATHPDLQSAMGYVSGPGLQQVTTLTAAALRRGAAQVTCDTDVLLVLALLAAETLEVHSTRSAVAGTEVGALMDEARQARSGGV